MILIVIRPDILVEQVKEREPNSEDCQRCHPAYICRATHSLGAVITFQATAWAPRRQLSESVYGYSSGGEGNALDGRRKKLTLRFMETCSGKKQVQRHQNFWRPETVSERFHLVTTTREWL